MNVAASKSAGTASGLRSLASYRAAFRPFSGRRVPVQVRAAEEEAAPEPAAEEPVAVVDTETFSFNYNE